MTFIDSLIRLILDFIPLRLIRSNEQGVIEIRGRYWRTVGPGLYPHCKFIFEVDNYFVSDDGYDCPNQVLTTKDGKRVSVSANVTYRIQDAGKLHRFVRDVDKQMGLEAMRVVARVVRRYELGAILPRQPALERSIRKRLATLASDWGVEVTGAGLTHFAETRPIHLLNDQQWRGGE
jgi:regulator of protease activity HflC (stomatin/prohibitin superfamily)